MTTTTPTLDRLLAPQSIAVIGSTSKETGLGSRTLRHLRDAGFAGEIRTCRSATDIKEPVDVAVIAVPSGAVQGVLDEIDGLAAFAVVYSSGFEELGKSSLTTTRGTRIVGPNTVGLYYAPARNLLTFAQAFDDLTGCRHGSGVFLISQSGAFGARLVRSAQLYGLHLDGFVGTGNETDLEACGIARELVDSAMVKPRVIMLYLESLRAPDSLISLLAAARDAGIPVVALLGGLSEAGSAAAASHTSAVSSDHQVVTELFHYFGATLVHSDRELVQATLGLALLRRSAGRRVGVVTGSGGAGVVAADILSARGLELPRLSSELQAKLAAQLPAIASTRNPVDVTAQTIGDDAVLRGVCTTLRDSGEVDLLLVIGREDQARAVGAVVDNRVPTVVAVLDRDASGVRARIEQGEVVLPDLAAACAVLAAAAAPPQVGKTQLSPHVEPKAPAASAAPTAADSLAIIEKAGVPVAPWRLVSTVDEINRFGDEVGWPIVLKANLPAATHKAKAGGVRLDVYRGAVQEQAADLFAHGGEIIAAKQLRAGLELFAGVRRDPQWGLVVSAGLGGANIELLKTTVAMPAQLPVSWLARRLADEIFHRVPGRYDQLADGLAEAAAALVRVVVDGGFELVECNPFAVVGDRIVAVDARVVS